MEVDDRDLGRHGGGGLAAHVDLHAANEWLHIRKIESEIKASQT